MAKNVGNIIAKLSPAHRKTVERRAAELLFEETTLRQLRDDAKNQALKGRKARRVSAHRT